MTAGNPSLDTLFCAAVEIASAEDRAAYLARTCGSDSELRARVEKLVAAHFRAGNFLAFPVPAAQLVATLEEPPVAECPGAVIGPYKLLEQIGEGGMGLVFMAEQSRPVRRRVALKVIKPGMDTRQVVVRFEAEQQALALMDHPHIAHVFDAGTTDSGRPYFVMELVEGVPITEFCDQRRLITRQRLELFVTICQAVQHAHQKGIIHRDLKPSNVLVTLHDTIAVPKIIDFGIAKAISQPLTEQTLFTHFAQMIGTPLYMSPEQAEMNGLDVDTRSDVYSLGVLLYELLTGTTPFEREQFKKASDDEMRRIIRDDEPPRPSTRLSTIEQAELSTIAERRGLEPRRLSQQVRGELDWIVMKALEKDRNRRYESASAFAADVQRYLDDEPVQACPPSKLYRLGKLVRRHKAGLAALFTGFVISIVAVAIIGEARTRITQTRAQAEKEKADARAQAEKEKSDVRAAADREIQLRLEVQLYFQRIGRAERELAANNLDRADELLTDCPARLRNWEWHHLRRCFTTGPQKLHGHQAAVSAVAFSPDGRLLASASHDRTLKVWDATLGAECFTLAGHADAAYDVVFSPDGGLLASAGWDGVVKLGDVVGRREIRTLRGHTRSVRRLAFAPDGQLLASLGSDNRVLIWDLSDGKILETLEASPGQDLYQLAFAPDGGQLAVTSSNGVCFWDPADWRLQRELPVASKYVKCLAFSPDGRLLATGEGDLVYGDPGRVRLWDLATLKLLGTFEGHTEPVFGLAFSPNGSRLFSASQDKTVKIWDLDTGQEALTLRAHTDTVRGLAISPNGFRLATAGADGTVQIWDATPGEAQRPEHELLNLAGHSEAVYGVAFSPDGRRLASVSHHGSVVLWDAASGQLLPVPPLPETTGNNSLAFSPDGQSLAVASSSGKIYLLDAKTGKTQEPFVGHRPGPIKQVAFSPDGSRLASAGWDRTVRVWDANSGEERLVLSGHTESVLGVAFRPDGRLLASAGYDNTVRIWDARTGESVHTPLTGHASRVQGVAFSRSGRLLASAGNDNTVRVWDTNDWAPVATLRGHNAGVSGVAFGADDRFLASASHDRTVKVWNLDSRKAAYTFRGHTDRVHGVAFSPDGTRVASASQDRTVKVWEVIPPQGR